MNNSSLVERLRIENFSETVITAFEKTDRSDFVPKEYKEDAYLDHPLPIGESATISQPSLIAYMLDKLDIKPEHKVLEVGFGSGYVAALLSHIAKHVVATERNTALFKNAPFVGKNVTLLHTTKTLGAPEHAPFDRIIVSAAAPIVPKALLQQLKDGGKMIIPLGQQSQYIWLVTKTKDSTKEERLVGVRFVPLIV